MVLSDDFNGKMVFFDFDVGASPDSFHQSALNFGTGIVGMVQNAKFRMSALAVEVELAVGVAVEVDAPFHQLFNLFGSLPHHLLNGSAVADKVARYHGVLDVLVEVIDFQIGHRGHATLCERGVGFVERCLANHAYFALFSSCHFQRVAHASHSCADDEKIIFFYHGVLFLRFSDYKSNVFQLQTHYFS